jgi:hypothetical protein
LRLSDQLQQALARIGARLDPGREHPGFGVETGQEVALVRLALVPTLQGKGEGQ